MISSSFHLHCLKDTFTEDRIYVFRSPPLPPHPSHHFKDVALLFFTCLFLTRNLLSLFSLFLRWWPVLFLLWLLLLRLYFLFLVLINLLMICLGIVPFVFLVYSFHHSLNIFSYYFFKYFFTSLPHFWGSRLKCIFKSYQFWLKWCQLLLFIFTWAASNPLHSNMHFEQIWFYFAVIFCNIPQNDPLQGIVIEKDSASCKAAQKVTTARGLRQSVPPTAQRRGSSAQCSHRHGDHARSHSQMGKHHNS